MTAADIPFAVRLKTEAGWNQTEADWRRFLGLSQGGSLVAEWDGVAAGAVATFLFGTIGWIAMLLVDKSRRRRGIGARLLQDAIATLKSRGAATIRLDATPLGRPIYEGHGFRAEYDLYRFEGTLRGAAVPETPAHRVPDIDRLCRLDREATGTERRALLERLARETPAWSCIAEAEGDLTGYLFTRPGSRAVQVGPVVAKSIMAGEQLLGGAASQLAGTTIFIDIPKPNTPSTRWAESQGLVRQRVLTRMFLGEPVNDRVEMLWASSGPEKG